ncbi:MAG: hypothetical protein JNL70_28235 [Saprospiraceae bacterium]|nr:hypothetical protein [Saprospiraceae bacterium]
MKFIVSISLNCILLFVFTTVTTPPIWACGKDKCKKESVQHLSNCQKDCCKKSCSDSKKKKKGCCGGDDCSCSPNLVVIADLPDALPIILTKRPITIQENSFFFISSFPKSSIQDIWQPPITVLSI